MSFTVDVDKIAFQVFTTDNLIKCDVIKMSQDIVTAVPVLNKTDMFQKGYPVVCMYLSNGTLEFRSGEILDVNDKNSELTVSIHFEEIKEERRIFERYPVSLEVSARRKFSNKRFMLVAKDLSEYGLGALSKTDLELDEIIDMNLITGKYMFYFVGKVAWKKEVNDYFEYGFQLTEFDITTKASMESYLGKLYEEYKKLFQKSK
jgi:hypothetical protein